MSPGSPIGGADPSERVATRAHRSAYPNPVSFRPGDTLETGERDSDYPGWIRVTTADGNRGWAPEQYLSMNADGKGATATRDYCARELDTEADEPLQLISELNQWALVRNAAGDIGWVPLDSIGPPAGRTA